MNVLFVCVLTARSWSALWPPCVCVCVRGWRWVPPPPPPPHLCRLSGLCTDLRLPCSPSAGVATTHPGSPLVFLVLLLNFISSARCVAHHRSRGLFFRGKTCRCKMDWGDNSAKCGYLGKGEYFCREQPFWGVELPSWKRTTGITRTASTPSRTRTDSSDSGFAF